MSGSEHDTAVAGAENQIQHIVQPLRELTILRSPIPRDVAEAIRTSIHTYRVDDAGEWEISQLFRQRRNSWRRRFRGVYNDDLFGDWLVTFIFNLGRHKQLGGIDGIVVAVFKLRL